VKHNNYSKWGCEAQEQQLMLLSTITKENVVGKHKNNDKLGCEARTWAMDIAKHKTNNK